MSAMCGLTLKGRNTWDNFYAAMRRLRTMPPIPPPMASRDGLKLVRPLVAAWGGGGGLVLGRITAVTKLYVVFLPLGLGYTETFCCLTTAVQKNTLRYMHSLGLPLST